MNTPHVTMAAPPGTRGGKQCPAKRIGTPESGCLRRSMGSRTSVWAVVASVLATATVACGQGPSTSYIFGIDDNSGLWLMEFLGTISGTSTLLLSSTLTKTMANGLAYDSFRDQLFAVDTSNGNLWWLQSGARSFTSLGSISAYTAGIGQPASAAYYDNAYWFLGGGPTGNLLGKVSLSYAGDDGVPTVVSGTTFTITGMPTVPSGGGDMVITKSGILYAYSAPALGTFFTADVTTAASGTVGGYSVISTTSGTGLQLAFDAAGMALYGTDRNTGNWYTVDTSNGNLTQVLGFQTLAFGGKGFNDLGGSAGGIPLVPEPSTSAMALAGLACGGISIWWRRRRS